MKMITPSANDAETLFQIELENYGLEESTEMQIFEDIVKYPEDFKGYSLKALMCERLCGFYCTIEDNKNVELVVS